jgi:hypothetical protein
MATTKIFLGNIKGPKGDPGLNGTKGEKGDSFRYEDFTPEQLDELAGKILPDVLVLAAYNVCYVSAVLPSADVGDDGDICVIRG